jgi:hypothetical protein
MPTGLRKDSRKLCEYLDKCIKINKRNPFDERKFSMESYIVPFKIKTDALINFFHNIIQFMFN